MKDTTDILQDIFETVNSMNEFAEKKNGALVAFNAALAIGMGRALHQQNPLTIWSWLAFLFIGLGCMAAFWSFFPVLKKKENVKNGDFLGNMYFFGDIASSTPASFYNRVRANTTTDPGCFELDMCLASQIVTNSAIALRKFVIFKSAAVLSILGFIFFCLATSVFKGAS